MTLKFNPPPNSQGGPKARRSWQARLAQLFGVVAGVFLGLSVAGIATGQIDTAPDTLIAFGAFIAIPAILAVVFSALAARARKQSATGSVAQQDPSRPRNESGTPER
jgi:FtsH-binding integral membrane protein